MTARNEMAADDAALDPQAREVLDLSLIHI